MHHRFKVLMALAFLASAVWSGAAWSQVNTIPNGGFEQADAPAYWHKVDAGDATVEWASDQFRSPQRSLKISEAGGSDAPVWESSNLAKLNWNPTTGTTQNVEMEIGGWVKTAGVGLHKSSGHSSSSSMVSIQVDSPYYWASGNHHEWRVWLKAVGQYPTSWIQCIRWENNYGGSWHDWDWDYERIGPDGPINGYYQVRVMIQYANVGVGIYPDPITIGAPSAEIDGEWPGGSIGAYYGYCD